MPDHRNVPERAGRIVTNGAVTGSGIRPRTTIGSENTIRISFASPRVAISPVGPLWTTVNPGEAEEAEEADEDCCAIAGRENETSQNPTDTTSDLDVMTAILELECVPFRVSGRFRVRNRVANPSPRIGSSDRS